MILVWSVFSCVYCDWFCCYSVNWNRVAGFRNKFPSLKREWPSWLLPPIHKEQDAVLRVTWAPSILQNASLLIIVPNIISPNILYYKHSEGNRLSWWCKLTEKKAVGLFLEERCARSALQSHIPKPVIINGLTSTGKKKKDPRVWKLRTKEIPADKVKTN